MEVRTRIAPSPTGDPHVGTLYMALFNFIFARHYQGKFILRIEDTDQTRSRIEYEQSIINALRWLNIGWDEGPDIGGEYGPYRQSERTVVYQKYAQMLLKSGHAYKCFATSEELQEMRELRAKMGQKCGYDRRYRNLSQSEIDEREKRGDSYVIRLKVPLTGTCTYVDMVKGEIQCPWSDIDDQVLLKSDGFPTYHLANVVDDHLMQISHIIRGDEWMTSTPKHMLLYDVFGWERPKILHMPLLLGSDGKKLSKRKNPTSAFYYKESGYLPEAFINFLSLMGYSMPDNREIYSLDAIIEHFSTHRIGISGAFFDVKKLDWINQHYLMNHISSKELWGKIKEWGFSDERMISIAALVHTRIKTFAEFMELCQFFFVRHLPLTESLFISKDISREIAIEILQCMIWEMDEGENWGKTGFEKGSHAVKDFLGVHYKKIVIPILFAAVMGKHQGPPLFDSVAILGKDVIRARLLKSIEFLGGISNKKVGELKKKWDQRSKSSLVK